MNKLTSGQEKCFFQDIIQQLETSEIGIWNMDWRVLHSGNEIDIK